MAYCIAARLQKIDIGLKSRLKNPRTIGLTQLKVDFLLRLP